jgi:hypothetical protein
MRSHEGQDEVKIKNMNVGIRKELRPAQQPDEPIMHSYMAAEVTPVPSSHHQLFPNQTL